MIVEVVIAVEDVDPVDGVTKLEVQDVQPVASVWVMVCVDTAGCWDVWVTVIMLVMTVLDRVVV